MTLNQIYFLLCESEILKKDVGQRTTEMKSLGTFAGLKRDEEGFVKGRDADGNPIKAKIYGKSLARRLKEEAEEKARQEALKKMKESRKRKRRK